MPRLALVLPAWPLGPSSLLFTFAFSFRAPLRYACALAPFVPERSSSSSSAAAARYTIYFPSEPPGYIYSMTTLFSGRSTLPMIMSAARYVSIMRRPRFMYMHIFLCICTCFSTKSGHAGPRKCSKLPPIEHRVRVCGETVANWRTNVER